MILPGTPALRALAAGLVVGGALLIAKPPLMFTEDGTPKIWSTTAPAQLNKGIETTPLPWWLASVLVLVAVDLFV